MESNDRAILHREYYSKLVTKEIKLFVSRTFGITRLVECKCPHFSDIPLKQWDALAGYLPYRQSLAERVCILKEAAKQLVEEYQGV